MAQPPTEVITTKVIFTFDHRTLRASYINIIYYFYSLGKILLMKLTKKFDLTTDHCVNETTYHNSLMQKNLLLRYKNYQVERLEI